MANHISPDNKARPCNPVVTGVCKYGVPEDKHLTDEQAAEHNAKVEQGDNPFLPSLNKGKNGEVPADLKAAIELASSDTLTEEEFAHVMKTSAPAFLQGDEADAAFEARARLAANPNATPRALSDFFDNTSRNDQDFSAILLKNPNTNITTIANIQFYKNSDENIIAEVAAHHKSDPGFLKEAFKSHPNSIRVADALIGNPKTPDDVLVGIAKNQASRLTPMRASLISSHPNYKHRSERKTDKDQYDAIVAGGGVFQKRHFLASKELSEETVNAVLKKGDLEEVEPLAMNPNLSAEQLSRMPIVSVDGATGVTSNQNADDRTLNRAIHNTKNFNAVDKQEIHENILMHPNVSSRTLDTMLENTRKHTTRQRLASHHKTSPETLAKLAKSKDAITLISIIRNKNTPADVLQGIADRTSDKAIRGEALKSLEAK